MAEDEQTGAAPDDADKPPEAPKRHRSKGRATGAKLEAESTGEGAGDAEASSESESPVSEQAATPGDTASSAEPPSPRGKPARGEEKTREAKPETPGEEPRPKSLVDLLRFERKGGKHRR
jgi:hypothetical protein